VFGVNDLITKINTAINSGTATEEQINYLSSAVESLRLYGAATVATPQNLPNPVTNKGRFFFVQSTNNYVLSNGLRWDVDRITVTPPLYAWGYNSFGQLGNRETQNQSSPVSVVGGFTDWVQVDASANAHTVGVRANGTAWGWGFNSSGQLGISSTAHTSSPVSVVGGFTDWVQVSVGFASTAGVRANGSAWGWGANLSGRLGDNTTVDKSSPVSVVGGFTDWVHVSAGASHTVGLRANGTAWAWGRNDLGQLGDNTTVNKSSPVSVVGGFTDWVQVSAGRHTVGLRANGTAWAWGYNPAGQLGDNTTVNKSSPVSVVGGFTDWVQVSAGAYHNIGIRTNGTAWAWGEGASGKLGDNTVVNKSSPVSVVGGFTDWVQVGADNHTVAIRTNGTAWVWGVGGNGRLGNNSTIDRSSPTSVVGGFTDWVQVACGTHTVGIRAV
jgi:alpha-tubulin suppressor-like RCC1 family protein